MQDEHFIRQWNAVHEDFAAGLDQAPNPSGGAVQTCSGDTAIIGSPYDRILDRRRAEPSAPALSPAAQASLRGLAASVITLALWVTVMLVATPAPGLAAAPHAPIAHAECVAHPVLA